MVPKRRQPEPPLTQSESPSKTMKAETAYRPPWDSNQSQSAMIHKMSPMDKPLKHTA